jgi:serine phosphatase RsbU (regulator of sigma subunit)
MLLRPDGTVTDLTAPVGPPLGIGWRGARVDGEAVMTADSTLLLFTDGLFERRGMGLDEGRELVRDFVLRSAHLPLALLCDQLLEELVGDSAEDDVAVLALRAHPVDHPRPAEAGPEWVPAVAATIA